jgi:hypothetical protein
MNDGNIVQILCQTCDNDAAIGSSQRDIINSS